MSVELGRITTISFSNNRIHVNVKTSPSYEHREIEFTTPTVGMWSVPREGDIVEVYEVDVETHAARFPHTPAEPEMPELAEGDFCFSLNEGTKLWFSNQEDGTVNVDLSCDGKLSINSSKGFELIDGDGYGITTEGAAGGFSWHHEDIDFNTGPKPPEPEE
jgi:hypothetical protein